MTTSSPTLIPPGGQRILVIFAHPYDADDPWAKSEESVKH